MDIAEVIKHRLDSLGLEQRDLANTAEVTESYISQLLTRKKAPPAPDKTDIYGKMERLLNLPKDELARVAQLQRTALLNVKLAPPDPIYKGVRELILRKCNPERERQIRQNFEQQPFGEIERLVTQKLLDVVKYVAAQELDTREWLKSVAEATGQSYEETRVVFLEFLDSGIHDLSIERCISFLDPLILSWDIDFETFAFDIALNNRLVPVDALRFEFRVVRPEQSIDGRPGFKEFLDDSSLSGDATENEIAFLKELRLDGRQPTPLYYYRELQNLRDPINFVRSAVDV